MARAGAHVALQARLAACLRGEVVSDPRLEPYYRHILGLDGGLLRPARPPRNGFLHPVDWLLVRWRRAGKRSVG